MKIEILQNEYCKGKLFQKGEQYEFIGTETVEEGCKCNNSWRQYLAYIMLIDFVKYHIEIGKARIVIECQNT